MKLTTLLLVSTAFLLALPAATAQSSCVTGTSTDLNCHVSAYIAAAPAALSSPAIALEPVQTPAVASVLTSKTGSATLVLSLPATPLQPLPTPAVISAPNFGLRETTLSTLASSSLVALPLTTACSVSDHACLFGSVPPPTFVTPEGRIDSHGQIFGMNTPLVDKLINEPESRDSQDCAEHNMLSSHPSIFRLIGEWLGVEDHSCVLIIDDQGVLDEGTRLKLGNGKEWVPGMPLLHDNEPMAAYCTKHGISPCCYDLSVDTGCDIDDLGHQEPCEKFGNYSTPYKKTNCASISVQLWGELNSTGTGMTGIPESRGGAQ